MRGITPRGLATALAAASRRRTAVQYVSPVTQIPGGFVFDVVTTDRETYKVAVANTRR